MIVAPLALSLALLGTDRPGYELVPPRELWEAAKRFEAKYETQKETSAMLASMLAARTSTVIRELVPVPAPAVEPGPSTTELVLGGAGLVVVGLLAGFLAAQ